MVYQFRVIGSIPELLMSGMERFHLQGVIIRLSPANPDETFYDLTVNKSGGNVKPITGSLQTITNNLLISNGTLDLGTNITTFNVGGTATVDGTLTCNSVTVKTITINGNLSGTGVLNMSGGNLAHRINLGGATNSINTLTSGTGSTVAYNRNGDQTMINSNNYTNLNVSVGGTKSFSSNVSVAGILNISTANIDCGANTLIVSNSAVGAIVRTTGTIIGKLQRAVSILGSEYLYPIGTAVSYKPARIIFNNLTSGSLIIAYIAGDIGNAGLTPPLNDNGIDVYDRFTDGYWSMTAIAPMASSDYDARLNYNGFLGVDASSRILRRDNGGNLTLDGTHGSIAGPYIRRNGLNGISGGVTDLAICQGQPHITTQPADAVICPGSNTTFSVTATGQAALSYQWQVDAGSGFGNISNGGVYSGVTTNLLDITGAGLSMNGYYYRCVVTDGGGNSLNSNSALLTTTESIAPTWSTAAGALNRTVECSDGAALTAAQALVPAATDNCDAALTPVKVSGAFAVGGCPQEGTYTNTWTVTDDCGNVSAVYTQVITIQDNTVPTWTTAANNLDRTVECSDGAALTAAQALVPAATDNCDAALTPVKISGAFAVGGCPQEGTYTNTWTVTDDCGNVSAVYTQVITIQDNTVPTWTTAANNLDRTVECSDGAALTAAQALVPAATDNCDAALTPVKVSGAFAVGGCPQEGTYTNTWTVTDDCGNVSAVYTQVITIQDNTVPTWTTAANNLDRTVECSDGAALTPPRHWSLQQRITVMQP